MAVIAYDVAIVGGGPAGGACAALCAASGLRTLLLERSIFPRDKVCGDCLNPACWPIFDRLGVTKKVLAAPHARLGHVEFIGNRGRRVQVALPARAIAISRRLLDEILLRRAGELGAEIREGTTVTAIAQGWKIETSEGAFTARALVAADGRNSSVARLLGLTPAPIRDRVGLQTYTTAPADFGENVALQFLPRGYAGVASVGAGLLNVCLVARPADLDEIKAWAVSRFTLPADQAWRTITPLARRPIPPEHGNLLLAGDAARVVEPFTGEGIYYALASGVLAADCIASEKISDYTASHARLYRGRLWVNRLAKAAVLSPHLASAAVEIARPLPALLRFLTAKVVGPPQSLDFL